MPYSAGVCAWGARCYCPSYCLAPTSRLSALVEHLSAVAYASLYYYQLCRVRCRGHMCMGFVAHQQGSVTQTHWL